MIKILAHILDMFHYIVHLEMRRHCGFKSYKSPKYLVKYL